MSASSNSPQTYAQDIENWEWNLAQNPSEALWPNCVDSDEDELFEKALQRAEDKIKKKRINTVK
ncbi:uncharacterized protein isoform X2 [Rhodnius prolixus]|uniref:uncharacterized protein isoform X2 n=1 Tax=Rhodnius prolixus TaxID=13249 RepID=UPI003D18E1A3